MGVAVWVFIPKIVYTSRSLACPLVCHKLTYCIFCVRHTHTHTHLQLPFKDFFVTHRGYMQDTEFSFPRATVATVGILLADRVQGPFQLEIQYIKAVRRITTGFQAVRVRL